MKLLKLSMGAVFLIMAIVRPLDAKTKKTTKNTPPVLLTYDEYLELNAKQKQQYIVGLRKMLAAAEKFQFQKASKKSAGSNSLFENQWLEQLLPSAHAQRMTAEEIRQVGNSCIYGLNISKYRVAAAGGCEPPNKFELPESAPLVCKDEKMVICNPLVCGLGEKEPICVTANSYASSNCETACLRSKPEDIAKFVEGHGLREKFNQLAAEFQNGFCRTDSNGEYEQAILQKGECDKLGKMLKRLYGELGIEPPAPRIASDLLQKASIIRDDGTTGPLKDSDFKGRYCRMEFKGIRNAFSVGGCGVCAIDQQEPGYHVSENWTHLLASAERLCNFNSNRIDMSKNQKAAQEAIARQLSRLRNLGHCSRDSYLPLQAGSETAFLRSEEFPSKTIQALVTGAPTYMKVDGDFPMEMNIDFYQQFGITIAEAKQILCGEKNTLAVNELASEVSSFRKLARKKIEAILGQRRPDPSLNKAQRLDELSQELLEEFKKLTESKAVVISSPLARAIVQEEVGQLNRVGNNRDLVNNRFESFYQCYKEAEEKVAAKTECRSQLIYDSGHGNKATKGLVKALKDGQSVVGLFKRPDGQFRCVDVVNADETGKLTLIDPSHPLGKENVIVRDAKDIEWAAKWYCENPSGSGTPNVTPVNAVQDEVSI